MNTDTLKIALLKLLCSVSCGSQYSLRENNAIFHNIVKNTQCIFSYTYRYSRVHDGSSKIALKKILTLMRPRKYSQIFFPYLHESTYNEVLPVSVRVIRSLKFHLFLSRMWSTLIISLGCTHKGCVSFWEREAADRNWVWLCEYRCPWGQWWEAQANQKNFN